MDNPSINIFGPIGSNYIGGIGDVQFASELAALNGAKEIDVHISSPGGDVFEGFNIFGMLKSNRATVNVFVDSLAASIASVVAMSGDTISIVPTGMVMIHNPEGATFGGADEHRKQADLLDRIRGQIADVYVSRTGKTKSEIVSMMTAETWLDATEAVGMNFADTVVEWNSTLQTTGA